jgi:hypothetical protein
VLLQSRHKSSTRFKMTQLAKEKTLAIRGRNRPREGKATASRKQ